MPSLVGSEMCIRDSSAPVPALDREVAEAQGRRVGLEPVRPTDMEQSPTEKVTSPEGTEKKPEESAATEPATAPVYRAVSQDELMGYVDDFEDEDPDDDAEYF